MSVALLVGRLVLAAVFATAGAAKLADRRGSREAVREFGVGGRLAGPVGFLLPLVELAVAACLIPGGSARWAAVAALLLLLAFATAIAVSLARGRTPDCHCFGQLHSAPAGWPTLARNVALAAVAALIVVGGPGESVSRALAAPGVVQTLAVAGVLLMLAAAIRLLASRGRRQAARGSGETPSSLPVGAGAPRFELLRPGGERVGLDTLLARGPPVLLVFTDPGCGPCTALLPEIGQWQRELTGELTVAVVSRGSGEHHRASMEEHGLRDVLVQTGRVVAEAYGASATPSAVVVSPDGTIASDLAAGAAEIRRLVPGSRAEPASVVRRRGARLPDLELLSSFPFSRRQGLRAAAVGALLAGPLRGLLRPSRASAQACPPDQPPFDCAGTHCCGQEVCCERGCCRPGQRCGPLNGGAFGQECLGCATPLVECGQNCCSEDSRCCGGECCGERAKCVGPPGSQQCELCEQGRRGCGDVCCKEDEICDPARNRCCRRESPDVQCLVPSQSCKDDVDEKYKRCVEFACKGSGTPKDTQSLKADAWFKLGCQAQCYFIGRRLDFDKCPKTPSDEACGAGRRCDPATGTCTPPRCAGASASTAASAALGQNAVGAGAVDRRADASITATDATARAIRRRLRSSRIGQDATRLVQATQDANNVSMEPAAPEVLAAIERYLADVLALRRSIAKLRPKTARGRTARKRTLTTLGYVVQALDELRRSALSSDPEVGAEHGRRARAAFDRVARSTSKTRRALGCRKAC